MITNLFIASVFLVFSTMFMLNLNHLYRISMWFADFVRQITLLLQIFSRAYLRYKRITSRPPLVHYS